MHAIAIGLATVVTIVGLGLMLLLGGGYLLLVLLSNLPRHQRW